MAQMKNKKEEKKQAPITWGVGNARQWKDGRITVLKVKSGLGGNLRIRTADPLVMKNGSAIAEAAGENPNPYFAVPEVVQPLISESANLEIQPVAEAYLYDVPTVAGKEYVFTAAR